MRYVSEFDAKVLDKLCGGMHTYLEYDEIVYDSDKYIIIDVSGERRYYYKSQYEHDGDKGICYGELCPEIVPSGFLHIIEELLGVK